MNKEELRKQFRVLQIIWGSMLGSLVIYVIICHLVGDSIRESTNSEIPIELLRNFLFVLSIGEITAIYFIRKIVLTVQSKLTAKEFLKKFIPLSVVTYGIAESIGIFGLIIYFLGDEVHILYIFIAISAGVLFYYRPVYEELEDYLKRHVF
ncbi:Uncharacterized protein dnl_47610 [Desulfonema limicola]|uniref:Uncharacterized protein n=2 Tax=Desulfonema limicola TaxID=45656 RepID=A0A975BBP0_9BACT|nr:Uncharacterized protein dnl_47610 [Desulfonema limicola]